MDHSELIAQFCAVTAADPELAEQYLSVADNNLESAITLFLESGGVSIESQQRAGATDGGGGNGSGADSISSPSPGGGIGARLTTQEDDEALIQRLQQEEYSKGEESGNLGSSGTEEVRERIRPVTERLVDPGFDSIYGGGSYGGMSSGFGGINQESSLARGRNAPLGIFNQGVPSSFSRQRGAFDDEVDVDDNDSDDLDIDIIDSNTLLRETVGTSRLTPHQTRLAALFRPPFDLIRNVDLETANQQAQLNNKWILINIQSIQEFACQQLNRDLWSNPDVKATVKENFIFLQYTSDDQSGAHYLQYYPIQKYPHIAILDPRTGERLKVWSEVPQVSTWIQEVHEFLSRFSLDPSHKNPVAKIPRNKTDVQHMTEEEQIEMAVRQSLGVNNHSSDEEDDDFVSVHSDMDEDYDDNDVHIIEPGTSRVTAASTAAAPTVAPAVADHSSHIEHIEISDSDDHEDDQLTEEDIFASILPKEVAEPEADPKTTTRIQFRLADGSRIIRRFRLNDSVKTIFSFLKQNVESLSGHYFSLASDRRKLIELIGETVESAKLQNSVVLVEIID